MPLARALLPWLLAGVLAGCTRSGTDLRIAPAPDALVDLRTLDPAIRIEMPYATPQNFTGVALYPVARCLLRREVAERLVRVERRLAARGLGLLVWDCYRPFRVQQRLWALVPDARYVAEPVVRDGRPVEGSKHNRGAAVDLTLVDAAGRPLEMPSGFDDFSERAHRGWAGASPAARRNAARLEEAMAAEGFEPLPTEWWHFDGPGWERYDLLDRPLTR
jgi:D-alanyl-D-alanine dipeptidase